MCESSLFEPPLRIVLVLLGAGHKMATRRQISIVLFVVLTLATLQAAWSIGPCLHSEPAKPTGYLASPNYPREYPHSTHCQLDLQFADHYRIKLSIREPFRTEQCDGCACDYLKVTEQGGTGRSQVWCGLNLPEVYESTSRHITLEFKSDGSENNVGFNLTWSLIDVPCGANFTGTNGEIDFSPGTFKDKDSCTWFIFAGSYKFVKFDLPKFFDLAVKRGADKIEIFDVMSNGSTYPRGAWATDGRAPASKLDSFGPTLGVRVYKYNRTTDVPILSPSSKEIKWTAVSECGDVLRSREGHFMTNRYPLSPESYSKRMNCTWDLVIPPEHFVKLKMTIEVAHSGGHCNGVEILDYSEANDEFLPRPNWCSNLTNGDVNSRGRYSPVSSDVISRGSKLRVAYQSNDVSPFFANWTTHCGGKRKDIKGNFSSPGYGKRPYAPNLDCTWMIEAPVAHTIRLDFNDAFNMEGGGQNCKTDYVEIFDFLPNQPTSPPTTTTISSNNTAYNNTAYNNTDYFYIPLGHDGWPVFDDGSYQVSTTPSPGAEGDDPQPYIPVSLGRFCGTKPPPAIVSSTNRLMVRFQTDDLKQGKGFAASWDSTCGDVYTSLEGSITSRNYPENYPDNMDCSWEIRVPQGHTIHLTFNKPFGLEGSETCDNDYLEVYDYTADGELAKKGRWCGSKMPRLLTSLTSGMMIKFHSDEGKNSVGFEAEWTSDNMDSYECGEAFTAPQGTFSTPSWPQPYPANQKCRWEIRAPEGQRVKLDFGSNFDLEMDKDCAYDGVEVLGSLPNGKLVSYGTWCSVTDIPTFYSTSKLVVLFYSDGDKNGKGFSASWTSDTECGGTFLGSAGHLLTPNFPNNYPNDQECRWEIGQPSGEASSQNVTLHFDPRFDLEDDPGCAYDYVEIFVDNESVGGKKCGTVAPSDVVSNGKTIIVVFKSDKSSTGRGFMATLS